MRFVCDSCRAQYMISDEKVGAKGVKVRCKKCGYVILVRRPDAAAPRAPAPAPAEGLAATSPQETAPAPGLDAAPTAPTGLPAAPAEGGAPTPPAGTALAAPPPDANPMGDAAPPWGGAPALDAEQATSPASASVAALAKAAEEAAAAGANGGLEGEAPFNAPPGDGPLNGAAAGGSVFSGVQEDEIGAVFDQVLSSGLQIDKPAINPLALPPENEDLQLKVDDDLQSTRVVSTDALKKIAEEAEAHASAQEAREQAKKNGAPAQDWFVAVDEQQVGPLALEKVKDMWDRGEIGPDSLCWRAGMADWTPLSDVKELASELAPKPSKPVVASPATSVVGSVVTVPVESTFNSGGVARVVRTEVPMAAAAPDAAADSGAWKPSAASALASLASEEIALAKKPKPRSLLESSGDHVALQVPAPAAKAPGLLDIPSAPADPGLNGKGMLNEIAPPPAAMPMAPAPALAQPLNAPYAGPAVYGGSVPYPTYATPLPRQGLSTTLKIAIGGAGALVLVLLVVVIVLLARPAPVVVQPPTATTAERDLPMPPPPPGTTERPSVQPPPAEAAPPPTPSPPAAVSAAPPAKPEVKPVEPVVAEREPAPRRVRERVAPSHVEDEVVTPKKKNTESDDPFDDLFGGGGGKKNTEASADGSSKRRGYIPPAPGGGDVKDELTDADVMQIVVRNKTSIAGCKQGSGTITMQWTILTSGRTTGVSVVSDDVGSASVGKCLTGLIKSWTFPKHRTQRPPIKFPFRF